MNDWLWWNQLKQMISSEILQVKVYEMSQL